MAGNFRFRSRAIPVASVCVALAACGSSDDDDSASRTSAPIEVKVLSNRADLVSDGNALVEVALPQGASAAGLRVDVGGRDVSGAFAQRADGRVTGVVTGLANGDNVVTARLADGRAARLTITNTPRGGPVLSGAQVAPYVCATPTPQPASGNAPATNASGLGTGAVDAQCNIATEFKLYYRTTTAGCSAALPDPYPAVPPGSATAVPVPAPAANLCFKPYDPAAARPADLAETTTDAGVRVPYIVRVERGTLNRGIYDIVVLHDPARAWSATAPQPQWNGKVFYPFGSSTGQPRRQIRPQGAWTGALNDAALARGYMVAMNSMTDSAFNSNRVMMSETVMMMKEHIVDTYGPVKFTMGSGCSGGSINSHMNASINPGLVDGFTVSCAYPDSETTTIEVGDCVQLVEAYQRPAWLAAMTAGGYTQAQVNAKKAAINGHLDQTACHGWFNLFGSNAKAGNYFQRTVGATAGASPAANAADQDTGTIRQSATPTNNCQLPAGQVYDPQNNPNGARCNAWSWAESIWGKANATQARDTRDNTGVQYGLGALRSGAITPEEFVLLNEVVGGTDRDTNLRAERSAADREALDIAYRAGIVMSGANLAKHAVIDMRGWDDSLLPANQPPAPVNITGIHYVWRSFSIRDRIQRDAGNLDSHALWRFGRTGYVPSASMSLEALGTMDRWLTGLKADASSAPLEQKVRAARPAEAFNFCYLSSDATQSNKVRDQAACDADRFLKPTLSPRQVAGGPRTEDILKCQLKPISAADYAPVVLNAAQLTRLQGVFPAGVCDWSKPGVGQQAPVSPLTFKAGPGGQPLGAAPASRPL